MQYEDNDMELSPKEMLGDILHMVTIAQSDMKSSLRGLSVIVEMCEDLLKNLE